MDQKLTTTRLGHMAQTKANGWGKESALLLPSTYKHKLDKVKHGKGKLLATPFPSRREVTITSMQGPKLTTPAPLISKLMPSQTFMQATANRQTHHATIIFIFKNQASITARTKKVMPKQSYHGVQG